MGVLFTVYSPQSRVSTSRSASAMGFTVMVNARVALAASGQASSETVAVKEYGSELAVPTAGVQQNLPVLSRAVVSMMVKVAPGIPLFHLSSTVSGSGVGWGGGGTFTLSSVVTLKQICSPSQVE